MKVIAISSGHGKYIRGASGYLDEVNEARRVVAEVATQMRLLGASVKGPFNDDISTSQNANLNRIVDWHNSQVRDLDVSVHFNANVTTSNPMGTECLYVTQESLAAEVSKVISAAGKLKNRGPKKRTDLFFLNNTSRPAILIETCFVDSKADADLYNTNFVAICKAIAQTLSGVDVPAKPPAEPEHPPGTPAPRPEIAKGDTGPDVVSVQKTLGLPPDGDFGAVTEAGVKGFQRAWGLSADGVVGPNTWAALDDLDQRMKVGNDGISDKLAAKIDDIVSKSPILTYSWPDRGKATQGYYAGMAKTFALAMLRYNAGDHAALIMGQKDSFNSDIDAISWYHEEFAAEEMENLDDGIETLRHLFVLMIGLGPCESSGNHWCGRDMSATNVESETAEAGLFQTSWNVSHVDQSMIELFEEFSNDPNGFRPTFTAGLKPTTANLDNYGSGDGAFYQWLAKFCPAFAAFTTGVGLRLIRKHWGPLGRREVDIVPEVDDLLIDVQRAVLESNLPDV